jgi:hypothetical protein
MNTMEIRKLLEKYYRGESSLQEEIILRQYFEAENIPEEFAAEKTIFRHYSQSIEVPEPSSGFEERIISALDSEEAKSKPFRIKMIPLIRYSSIAAGLLLLVGSYFFLSRKIEHRDTFSNPEIAYAETVRILFDVSSQFNHGTQQLNRMKKIEDVTFKSFETLNKSTRIIDKNLKNLDYFQQAFKIVSSPMDYVINK